MHKKIKKGLYVAFMIFLVGVVAVLGISYYALRQFTFIADPLVYGRPQSEVAQDIRSRLFQRSDISHVYYRSQDGLSLHGYLVQREKPEGNMVLCHGYRSSKEFMYGYIDMFPQFNILLFDFRAHGESEGKVTSIGCHEYKDVLASAYYMKEHLKSEDGRMLPLVVLGISMGAASAIKAASVDKNMSDALIVDSTFADLRSALERGFSLKSGLPHNPFFVVLSAMFQYFGACDISTMDTTAAIEKVTMPTMIIHSCEDNFLELANGLRLYDHVIKAKHKSKWIGPKCRHGHLHDFCPDEYKKEVLKFLHASGIQVFDRDVESPDLE